MGVRFGRGLRPSVLGREGEGGVSSARPDEGRGKGGTYVPAGRRGEG